MIEGGKMVTAFKTLASAQIIGKGGLCRIKAPGTSVCCLCCMIQVACFNIWNIEGMIPRTRLEEKCEEICIHFNLISIS